MVKKITVGNLFQLNEELKNLLGLKLKLSTRYSFLEIKNAVEAIINPAITLREDFIKKYGVKQEDGNVYIAKHIGTDQKKENPKFVQFMKEWEDVEKMEKELNYTAFDLSLIEDIETDFDVKIFFQLVN